MFVLPDKQKKKKDYQIVLIKRYCLTRNKLTALHKQLLTPKTFTCSFQKHVSKCTTFVSELKSCVKVEVAVLIVLMVSVDVKQH